MTFDSREKSASGAAPVECYRFVQGGNLWLWTSAAADVTLPVGTFTPAPIERGPVEFSGEQQSGSIDLRVPRDNPIAVLFVPGLPASPIGLVSYRAHLGEESDYKVRFVGSVDACRIEGSKAVLMCVRSSEKVRRQFPVHTHQGPCNHFTYSAGCGVNAADFRDSITVGSVSGLTITSSDFALRASGWFKNGFLELSGGGEMVSIEGHTGSSVTLLRPFSVPPVPGQKILAYAGDDRTEATCNTKFNNLVNFRGFPRVPLRSPFEGSVA